MAKQNTDAAWWNGQVEPQPRYGKRSKRYSQYLTMPDGIRLAVDIYLPARLRANDKIPTILCQTRYHRRTRYNRPYGAILNYGDPFRAALQQIIDYGYACVMVDVRGSGASFGSRFMEWSPDEVRDGAAVVNWIVEQPWSSGLVGVTGTSYVGGTAQMILVNQHPAVKAAHIRFALFDVYADIVSPGGVRNRQFLETWSELNEALDRDEFGKLARKRLGWLPGRAIRGVAPVDSDTDGRLLNQAIQDHQANYNILEAALGVEFRDDIGASGVSFDDFSPHAFVEQIERSGAAIYSWSSYYDGAHPLAAIKRFLNVRSPDNRLVLGPWDHGGLQNPDPFSYKHKTYFDHGYGILRYFDYHLKGCRNGIEQEQPVYYFTMGEEAWKSADTWPPPGFTPTPFYLAADHRLSRSPAADDTGADQYQVDYSATTGRHSRWTALANVSQVKIGYPDRREQDAKLLVFQSEPLDQALEVTGHPIITLYLCSTADDGQFFVYLEDVSPEGNVNYITEGMFRAIHRLISNEQPLYRMPEGIPYHTFKRADARPLVPGEVAELVFDLLPVSHLFKKGHAIRVAIAGADKDNFEVLPARPPQITVLRNNVYPSHIVLPTRAR